MGQQTAYSVLVSWVPVPNHSKEENHGTQALRHQAPEGRCAMSKLKTLGRKLDAFTLWLSRPMARSLDRHDPRANRIALIILAIFALGWLIVAVAR